jgi:hypothetical protein
MTFHSGGRCVFGLTFVRGFSSVFWLTGIPRLQWLSDEQSKPCQI